MTLDEVFSLLYKAERAAARMGIREGDEPPLCRTHEETVFFCAIALGEFREARKLINALAEKQVQ